MLTKRSILLVVITAFVLGTLLIASNRFSDCPDGSYCLTNKLTPFRPPPIDHKADSDASSDTSPPHTEPASEGTSGADEDLALDHSWDDQDYVDGNNGVPVTATLTAPGADGTKAPEPAVNETFKAVGADDGSCTGFPDTSNVLVVMKTGASEAYGKVPTQFLTNLKCKSEYVIFSDYDQIIAGHHIHNSLDNVTEEIAANEDFKLYWRQQKCAADINLCNKFSDAAAEGWALDKYKNVHIAEKAFAMYGDFEWYLFTDADTYVVWPTLMEWLKTLDATEKSYLGSVAYWRDFPFGHGGSGYLVSNPALKAMFDNKENVAQNYDEAASKTCCGDYLFAYALKQETGIDVKHMWPTINGEKPYTLQYSDEQWCQPIVTMHHIGAEEVSAFSAFEQERNYKHPMRIKDIFHQFVEPRLVALREDWDNGSDDEFLLDTEAPEFSADERDRAKKEGLSEEEKKGHFSVNNCKLACESRSDCMQFTYTNKICKIGKKIKHGEPVKPEEEERWAKVSGWNLDAIKKWVEEKEECPEIVFPHP